MNRCGVCFQLTSIGEAMAHDEFLQLKIIMWPLTLKYWSSLELLLEPYVVEAEYVHDVGAHLEHFAKLRDKFLQVVERDHIDFLDVPKAPDPFERKLNRVTSWQGS